MSIYPPAEDSYLLAETVSSYLNDKPNKNIKILDMGAGSGIQAENCKEQGFNEVLTADIDPKVVKYLKSVGFNSIETDLFSNISEKFSLILFNPPYLPEDKREPKDSKLVTTAGKKGYELILRLKRV